jgi:hypothetical protein
MGEKGDAAFYRWSHDDHIDRFTLLPIDPMCHVAGRIDYYVGIGQPWDSGVCRYLAYPPSGKVDGRVIACEVQF